MRERAIPLTVTVPKNVGSILQLVVLLAVRTAVSQAPGQSLGSSTPQVTISSHSELVLVPTIVTDRSGQFVSGLDASDFGLRENGRPQKVNVFEEVASSAEPLQRAASPGIYTNSIDRPTPRRLVVIAVDTVNRTSSISPGADVNSSAS